MRKIEVFGIFIIFALVYLISNINSSFSVSTYEINKEGEYSIPASTYVRTTNFYCKSFVDKTKNESRVYRNTTELIKMPDYASNYLFVVKNVDSKRQTGICEIYEYTNPEFNMTCISTHLNSNDTTKCDLYVTTSNYGIDSINLVKNNKDIKIIDLDSTNFNMNVYNDEFTFMPKNVLNDKTKYLVGTITLANTSPSDGKENILSLENIYIKDSLTSFKVSDVKHTFKEDIGSGIDTNEVTTTKNNQSPKTDIEYTSNNKNRASKAQVRNIIILFFVVIITSINLGFIIVFFYARKTKQSR